MKDKKILLIIATILIIASGIGIATIILKGQDEPINSNENINDEVKEPINSDNPSEEEEDNPAFNIQPVDDQNPEVTQNFADNYSVNEVNFSNIKYYYDDIETHIDFTIKNTSSSDLSYTGYLIVAIDQNGTDIFTFSALLDEPLKANEERQVALSTLGNYLNAYNLRFEMF